MMYLANGGERRHFEMIQCPLPRDALLSSHGGLPHALKLCHAVLLLDVAFHLF